MFLKNKNIIFKIRRSKVTDYAALTLKVTIATIAGGTVSGNVQNMIPVQKCLYVLPRLFLQAQCRGFNSVQKLPSSF